jgi:hypothetical protein
VASGSELKQERQETIQVVHELRKAFPALNLEAVEWETDIPSGSYHKQRIQDKINSKLDTCEIVLVLFYSRIGTFTREEFRRALDNNKKVFLYLKTGFSPKNKIEYDNYGKVIEFREEIENENRLLFKYYDTAADFKEKLYKDLNLYLSQTYFHEGVEPLPLLERLFQGSKRYYNLLRGSNGRFRFLRISDIILPGSGDQWLETGAALDGGQRTDDGRRTTDDGGEVTVGTTANEKLLRGGQGGGFLEKSPPGRRRQNKLTVLDVLPLLWGREIKHAVVGGAGGMGKTVSLIHWWEKLLGSGEHWPGGPVPVFIALNEFNQVPEGKREDFIMASVLKNYGGDDWEAFTAVEVKKTMRTPQRDGDQFIPSIVLLLDGFNEITVEKKELLLELNRLAEQCPGIQVVITGRVDMRGNFNWGHWNLVRLEELETEAVAAYLQGKGQAIPGPGRLRDLLGNPMMLTLYAASCEVRDLHRDSRYCCFKETVESPGELLWNFIEAQVARLPERVGPDEGPVVYYWFLLKYLQPGLGFEMAKQGLFDFTNAQFQDSLDRLCRRFARGDFLTASPMIGKYVKMLPLGECGNDLERHERAARVRDIFCRELHLLVEEGQILRFLHHDFRDFFAALHVLNEADIGLSQGEIPGVLKQGLLDYFVRRLVGEIEEEHCVKPYLVANEGWKIDFPKYDRLHRVLDLCRGKFGAAVGDAVWNIVMIWIEVRGELSGADLTGLDLSGIPLNGVMCSRFYEDRYLAAVFAGSRVHEKNLLPRGHTDSIMPKFKITMPLFKKRAGAV